MKTIYVIIEEWQIPTEHQTTVIAAYENYDDAKSRIKVEYDESLEWITSYLNIYATQLDSNIIEDNVAIVEKGSCFSHISIEEIQLK